MQFVYSILKQKYTGVFSRNAKWFVSVAQFQEIAACTGCEISTSQYMIKGLEKPKWCEFNMNSFPVNKDKTKKKKMFLYRKKYQTIMAMALSEKMSRIYIR